MLQMYCVLQQDSTFSQIDFLPKKIKKKNLADTPRRKCASGAILFIL